MYFFNCIWYCCRCSMGVVSLNFFDWVLFNSFVLFIVIFVCIVLLFVLILLSHFMGYYD